MEYLDCFFLCSILSKLDNDSGYYFNQMSVHQSNCNLPNTNCFTLLGTAFVNQSQGKYKVTNFNPTTHFLLEENLRSVHSMQWSMYTCKVFF